MPLNTFGLLTMTICMCMTSHLLLPYLHLDNPTTTSAAATSTSIKRGGHTIAASKPTPKAAQYMPVQLLCFTCRHPPSAVAFTANPRVYYQHIRGMKKGAHFFAGKKVNLLKKRAKGFPHGRKSARDNPKIHY